MLAVRVAKRQWATTAEPGIFSQIVICLFASGYLRYIVLQYVGPDTWRIQKALIKNLDTELAAVIAPLPLSGRNVVVK